MNSDADFSQSTIRRTTVPQLLQSIRSLHAEVGSDLAQLNALALTLRSAHDDIQMLAQSLSRHDETALKGQLPASEKAIESLPIVKVEEVDCECAICLERMEIDSDGKEMHCKHVFHSGCIEEWLRVRGSCPVCRYTMPDGEEEINNVSVVVDAVVPVL